MQNIKLWFSIPLILGLFFCSCSNLPTPKNNKLPMPIPESIVTLGAGDIVNIKFRYWPELDDTQEIRPDGKITLQLVDDVEVGGLAPEEADKKLTKLYETKLKNPEITVVVRTLASQKVYVCGEVINPGLLKLTGSMTVMEAIMEAGGYNKISAKLSNVLVIRQVSKELYVKSIDLKEAIKNPEIEPFYLAPKDIVYVTRTKIDQVDQWVDQYVGKLIRASGLGYSYDVGSKARIVY